MLLRYYYTHEDSHCQRLPVAAAFAFRHDADAASMLICPRGYAAAVFIAFVSLTRHHTTR